MILRRQLQLPLLTTALLLLAAASTNATIKGDKELEEPTPLPPKPLPVSINPLITHIDPLEDDEDAVAAPVVMKTSTPQIAADVDTPRVPVVGSGKISEEDVGRIKASSPTSKLEDPSTLHETPVDPITLEDTMTSTTAEGSGESLISPLHSLFLSFLMIIFSEIGDKTFLIAALMAMKHPRLLVFSAAFSSLIVMSILSAVLGHAVPTLIPKKLTNWLAAGLFLVFGVKMITEGLAMEKGTAGVQEEMKEVEQELSEKEAAARGRSQSIAGLMEEGRGGGGRSKNPLRRSTSSPAMSDSDSDSYSNNNGHGHGPSITTKTAVKSVVDGVQNLAGLLLSPAWVQTFVMTFLGEWGDRSQIATIAMAAGQDYWFVTIGAISGHALCTAGAVIGGKLLAEKISVRNVTLGGAVAFLVFAFIYGVEAVYT